MNDAVAADPMLMDWAVPCAFGAPLGVAVIRKQPQDFAVDEVLGFEPDDSGEHLLVQIEKAGLTTQRAARWVARALGVRERNIGWCGMKDRHAVTRQWFSLPWPIKKDLPDGDALNARLADDVQSEPGDAHLSVLRAHRHGRKLRPGTHMGNRFDILARWPEPPDADALTLLETALTGRVAAIRAQGCPNGFGAQRFGRAGDNAAQFVSSMQRGRKPSGILISAARSLVFNKVLRARVQADTWATPIDGDWLMLDGSQSGFPTSEGELSELAQRAQRLDLHPTGPMPGKKNVESMTGGAALAIEQQVLTELPPLVDGLHALGAAPARRALRLRVDDIEASVDDAGVRFTFMLGSGAFATSVIGQCLALQPD